VMGLRKNFKLFQVLSKYWFTLPKIHNSNSSAREIWNVFEEQYWIISS
jgi:hypothetical protein